MEEVNKYLEQLLNINDTIVVSCSGGPDSMCLLSLLLNFKKSKNLNIIVAHVNHKVREESEEEETFVKEYTKSHGAIFELLTINNYNKKNFHDDARVQRYKFTDELMTKYKAKYLFTAHHGDDLIETILMRIERGSNLTGYIGFKKEMEHNGYKVIRPLITLNKKEIKKFDDTNNIPYRIDKTNMSNIYTRNRYRNLILPLLREKNDDIQLKYLKFSQELNNYDTFIKSCISDKNILKENHININKYNNEDAFLKRKIIEMCIQDIQQKDEFYVTDSVIDEIQKAIESPKPNIKVNLNNGYVGIKEYDTFYISRQKEYKDYDILLKDRFENEFWIIKTDVSTEENSNYIFRFLSNEISLPLHIKSCKQTDIIKPKNLNGTKKVKDILKDCKIPLEKRKSYPLIVDNKGIVLAIPGLKKSQFDKDKSQKYDIIIKCKEKI